MKAQYGCKLFGAQQVFTGVQDGVTLLHSVVGCNFGSMGYHFIACDMSDVRQTCTVLSDSDIVFSGEASFRLALENMRQLYSPKQIFVLQGCVSDMIQDDLFPEAQRFQAETGIPVLVLEAAGYRGSFLQGYEAAALALLKLMDVQSGPDGSGLPKINLLGLGTDDYRLEADLQAMSALLGGKAELGCVLGRCTLAEIARAPQAKLNLCFGRGIELAKAMEQTFGIPYEILDYPYGLTGAKRLWAALECRLGLDYSQEEAAFRSFTGQRLRRVYTYLEDFYGVPVSILAEGSRARGLSSFLSRELGFRGALLVGHIGKLVKLAGGMWNTHSRFGDCRMELLAAHAAALGLRAEKVRELLACVMCDDCLRILKEEGLYAQTLTRLASRIEENLGHKCGEMTAGAIVFSKEYGLLCQTTQAQTLLQQIREG